MTNCDNTNIQKRETRFRVIYQILRGKKVIVFANTEDVPSFEDAVAKVKNQMANFVTKKGDLLIVRALKIDWATFEENTLLSGKRVTTRPIKIEIMDTEELKNRLNNNNIRR